MRPPTIVDWMEANKPSGEPLVMSEPSKTWVDRMWHALLDPDTSDESFGRLDDLFIDYLVTLGEDERLLAEGAFQVLMHMAAEGHVPRCVGCGAPVCPHCGERYRNQPHGEEAER